MHTLVTLTVVDGQLSRSEYVIAEPGVYTVGRGRACAIRFPDDVEHMTMSRHHCELVFDGTDVVVHDCLSRNGTFVNGVNIGGRAIGGMLPSVCPLREGDELRVGKAVLRLGVSFVADRDSDRVAALAAAN